MYSISQLKNLSDSVGRAIRDYHGAIAENLRTLSKELKVQGNDPDEDGVCVCVEHDGGLFPWTVDRIKWSEEHNSIMVHATMMNYCESDDWCYLSDLGDATDYVLDAIQWPEIDTEWKQQTFPIITLDREDLKMHLNIDATDIPNVTMESIASEMEEWFLGDFSQALRECATACGVKAE